MRRPSPVLLVGEEIAGPAGVACPLSCKRVVRMVAYDGSEIDLLVQECGSAQGRRDVTRSRQEICETLRDCFAQRQDVVCAYLFGSHATGDAHAASDIDVAVLLDSHVDGTLGPMVEIEGELKAVLPEPVFDVVILNHAGSRLRREVVTAGLPVFERDRDERIEFEVKCELLYFDWQPIERQFDEAAFAWAQGAEVT